MKKEKFVLPEIQKYDDASLVKMAKEGRFEEISFEYLRSCAMAILKTVSVIENTKEFKEIQRSIKYGIALGHISKILSLSNGMLHLDNTTNRDSIEIISRQICEVGIQCLWMLNKDDRFDLYLNRSLSHIKFCFDKSKNLIQELGSEEYYLNLFRDVDKDLKTFVPSDKGLPDILEMLQEIDFDQILFKLYIFTDSCKYTTFENIKLYFEKNESEEIHPTPHIGRKAWCYCLASLVMLKSLEKFCNYFYTLDVFKKAISLYCLDGIQKIKPVCDFSLKYPLPHFVKQTEDNLKKTPSHLTSGIASHKRQRKDLIPPWLSNEYKEKTKFQRASNDSPDVLWIIMLVIGLGRKKAFVIFNRLISYLKENKNLHDTVQNKDLFGDITFTGISKMDAKAQKDIMNIILNNDSKKILNHLIHIHSIPSKNLWISSLDKNPPKIEDSLHFFMKCLYSVVYKKPEHLDAQWLKIICLVVAGRLKFTKNTEEYLKILLEYPHHPNPDEIASMIRAFGFTTAEIGKCPEKLWVQKFWDEMCEKTSCIYSQQGIPTEKFTYSALKEENLFHLYNKVADAYLMKLPSDISIKDEVIFGSALFIIKIALEIISENEKKVISLISIRTIAETIINLKFLLSKEKENNQIWEKYRNHGIGQAKLSFLKNRDEVRNSPYYIPLNILEGISNEDHWSELVKINLGDWSGDDLRTRSMHSNAKDIYDDYYQWPSCISHAQWCAIRYTVFDACVNPMHERHRIPLLLDFTILKTVKYDLEILINHLISILNNTYPNLSLKL